MQMRRAATLLAPTQLNLTAKKPEHLHRPAARRPRQTASPSDQLQESEVNESMKRRLLISFMLIRREQQSAAVELATSCTSEKDDARAWNMKPIRMETHLQTHRRKQRKIGCKRRRAAWWDGLSMSPGDEDESPVGKKGIKSDLEWFGGDVVTR